MTKSPKRSMILLIVVGLLTLTCLPAMAAQPLVVKSFGEDVIDQVTQHQRRLAVSSTWENIDYPETTYKTIVFMNGYEFTGTTVSYVDDGFDGFYFWRYKVTKYHYRTW